MIIYISNFSIITYHSLLLNHQSYHSLIYSISIHIYSIIISSLSSTSIHLLSLYITQNLISCNHLTFV